MESTTAARETWLNALADKMAPRFAELEWPLKPFRVSIGFTGAPKESKVAGVCWHSSASADKRFEIFISPDQAEPMAVAAILAHELTHAAVGFDHGHKGDFAKCVAALGLVRPFTHCNPGPEFHAWAQPFLDELGPLPHAPLMFRKADRPTGKDGGDAGEGGEDGEGAGGSSNDKKKQSTRLLKAACTHKDGDGELCGYTVRLSGKWARKLGACCPAHGPMEVEGADQGADGEEQGGE